MAIRNIVLVASLLVQYLAISPVQSVQNCHDKQARYKLDFFATWSSKTHTGAGFPSNGHFSSVVGASHNSNYIMWAPGILATPGVKLVAEAGNRATLLQEIEKAISQKTVLRAVKGPSSAFNSPHNLTNVEVFVNDDYPLVSIITMIAPSPDWFVGVHDLNLCGGQSFNDRVSRDVFVYDSGTDSGTKFTSLNSETSPPKKIFRITKDMDTPFNGNTTIPRFGYMVFTKLEEVHKNETAFIPPNSKASKSFAIETVFLCLFSLLFVKIFQ